MTKLLIFRRVMMLCLCLIAAGDLSSQTSRGMKIKVRTEAGTEIELYKDSYALVVGNGTYTNGWDPLEGALKDVKEVETVLQKHGFNVTLKTDLTEAEFRRAFAEFVLKSGEDPNNRLLFYYAGHGYTRKSATGEDLGYLVMVGAPVPEIDKIGFEIESIPMESLVAQAEKILARHVLFIFDSCFSGTILNARDRLPLPESISDSIKYPIRQFITAGRAGEVVPDYSDFKQAFLDLLEGRADDPFPDGYITGEELGFYLKRQVPVYNPAQHPQYGTIRNPKLDKGDFVFVLQEVLPTVATLTVTSIPSGASVYIDGDFIEQTPLHNYEIDTGSQREKQIEVRLELSGYKNRVAQLTLRGGQQTPWDVGLEKFSPRTGTLTVTSTPSGADIYVDNAWIGKTPLTSYEVDTGVQREKQVTVGLVLSGYKNHVARLTLRGGQQTPLKVRLERFIPRTGTLTVTSTPSGASVYINGDLIGQTPLHNYEIDTGSQREKQIEVRLELSGYKNRVAQLTLRGGQQTPWDVGLEPLIPRTGALTVTSTPSGADIYFDNTWVGKTPLTSYEVDTGVQREKQVTVGLVLSGYKNRVSQLTVRAGQQTPWDVGLEPLIPRTGTLTVTSTPSGASVYIDGDFIGQTPLHDYEIDTGSQREKQVEIRLELSGYKSHVSKLTLKGGQQTPLDVRLEKAPAPLDSAAPEGMVLIPAGKFRMGSNAGNFDEKPVHTVYVDAFYMDAYEVTNAQYKKFVDAKPQWGKDNIPSRYHDGNYLKHWSGNGYPSGKGNHPVTYVSWYAAMAYAQWAGKRLPTEAEWEKAARGGLSGKKYPWGDSINPSKANYDVEGTTTVGRYAPNLYGLYDMAGNVWEWCLDEYQGDYYKISSLRNPIARANSIKDITSNFTNIKDKRVLRGGSWISNRISLRVATRRGNTPMFTNLYFGFRCARSVSP